MPTSDPHQRRDEPDRLTSSSGRAALIIGHPGHELRVHGWLARVRPRVFVLTDGSSHDNVSRVSSTQHVLDATGCPAGSVFGRFTDRAFYDLLLARDVEPLISIVDEIAATLVKDDVEQVACDAAEGYNPAHDVCQAIAMSAVACASRARQRTIELYDFPLVAPPTSSVDPTRGECETITLDADELDRKILAAQAYPELKADVEAALRTIGRDAFLVERFWRLTDLRLPDVETYSPFYESHGADRVHEGTYEQLLTYRDHVRPVCEALAAHAAAPRAAVRSATGASINGVRSTDSA
jgi:hypothetical protein